MLQSFSKTSQSQKPSSHHLLDCFIVLDVRHLVIHAYSCTVLSRLPVHPVPTLQIRSDVPGWQGLAVGEQHRALRGARNLIDGRVCRIEQ